MTGSASACRAKGMDIPRETVYNCTKVIWTEYAARKPCFPVCAGGPEIGVWKAMKIIKKTAAALMALLLAVTTAACSGDKSWAAKDDSLTVPIGSYIYELYSAYGSAASSVPDSAKPVLEQKIDGKDAESWIRDKALENVKSIFVINRKMKELGLTLTQEETKSVENTADSGWQQAQPTLEKYGIAKSSFQLAYAEYYTKYSKVFSSLYGKGGKKEVSDADLKNYFEKNYTDFSYMLLPLYKTDANGGTKPMTAEEKKAAQKEFDGYAAKIKSGEMTLRQAADAYKKSSKAAEDPLRSDTAQLTSGSGYPDALRKMIEPLKVGEVKTGELQGLYAYVLVQKNDITKKSDDQLKNGRGGILSAMKGKEFESAVAKEAGALTGVTLNDNAINSYKPSMFADAFSASAPAAK